MKEITLEEKIGQLFICGFDGLEANQNITELIKQYYIGGVCYFSRNTKSPKQLHHLSHTLQQQVSGDTPLFIGIDQEGGMVVRIDKGVTLSPGNMALGATKYPDYAYQMARIVGQELKAMGININFAPSVDVNNNPNNPVIGVRSFGDHPESVARFGAKAIQGYQDAGISASAKHFPGHGDTETDSHLGIPIVHHSLERMNEVELLPFREAINAGVDTLMVSHVCFPAIEKDLPATLSKKIITDLLRNKYHYDGVVITDCIEMQAVEATYGIEESAIRAINAGNDIVLVSHTFSKQKKAITAVKHAVETGRISMERIDESYQRIIKLKSKRIPQQMDAYNDSLLASPEHLNIAEKISEYSTTVMQDKHFTLPLSKHAKTVVCWPEIETTSIADEVYEQGITLGECLQDTFTDIEEIQLGDEQTIEKLEHAEQVIIASYNAVANKKQRACIDQILYHSNGTTVLCAFRNPYDLDHFPNVDVYIAAYELQPNSIRSVAKVITGERVAIGMCPVIMKSGF